jgi:hypothetical protein
MRNVLANAGRVGRLAGTDIFQDAPASNDAKLPIFCVRRFEFAAFMDEADQLSGFLDPHALQTYSESSNVSAYSEFGQGNRIRDEKRNADIAARGEDLGINS